MTEFYVLLAQEGKLHSETVVLGIFNDRIQAVEAMIEFRNDEKFKEQRKNLYRFSYAMHLVPLGLLGLYKKSTLISVSGRNTGLW